MQQPGFTNHNQSAESSDLIGKVRYRAALVVTGCWKGTSRDSLYKELGWESLCDRRHFRRLSLYYKIKNDLTPSYLKASAQPFDNNNITSRFKNSFFPYCYHHWNNLDNATRNSSSLAVFNKALLDKVRLKPNSCFQIRDRQGVSIITKLRVNFSDLREHRLRHNFNCFSADCVCGADVESTTHFLLHCKRFSKQRSLLLSKLKELVPDYEGFQETQLVHVLLYGRIPAKRVDSAAIINNTISFIKNTKRFDTLEAFQ